MQNNNHFVYDKVYLIGVDGAGCFFTQTSTPQIDRIFKNGAYNNNVITAIPTISAQCWGSMLHGVSPQAHRFTNGLVGDFPVPEDHPFPSIFKIARKAYPDAKLASISNWNPINFGIIEQKLDVIMGTGNDDEVLSQVLDTIETYDPKLLFVQFDSVDGAGHKFGYGEKGHLEQITYVDSLIGQIYDAAVKKGNSENLLFMVTADHGGSPDGHHGDSTDAEKIVSFYAKGRTVKPGSFGYMEIRDTAAVVAFALGIKQPQNWSSRIPDNLFSDGISFDRPSEAAPDGTKRYSDRSCLPTPAESGKTLGNFINTDTLLCYFTFDKHSEDEVRKCTAEVDGKLYYTDGFYGKAALMDDCKIYCSSVNPGTGYFTFCCWLKINKSASTKEAIIFSTMKDEYDTGLVFSVCGDEIITKIGTGNKVIKYTRKMPDNYDGNWFHFICSYDRKDDELCYYYDFTIDSDWYNNDKIPQELKLDGKEVTIGNYTPLCVDDIMVFDHKLSDHEIDELQKYYEQ